MNRRSLRRAAGAAMIVLTSCGASIAADHLDAPIVRLDSEADINDVYVFESPQNPANVVFAMTFGGVQAASAGTAAFDLGVLYQLRIDTNSDNVPDLDVSYFFGIDPDGNFGVFVDTGFGEPLIGYVGDVLTSPDGVTALVDVFDDPFFFDLTGFQDTIATGMLAFQANRDFFRRKNTKAMVVEIPRSALGLGNVPFTVYAATSRLAGGNR
jgi:hypothetical protein